MTTNSEWEIYIIQAESGQLYTGITTDFDRRFKEHTSLPKKAKFFNLSKPEKVVFREKHPNRSEATKREIQIKKMTRSQKFELINSCESINL